MIAEPHGGENAAWHGDVINVLEIAQHQVAPRGIDPSEVPTRPLVSGAGSGSPR